MVIRGRTRGGGVELAKYLLAQGENEHIAILDVDGRENANDNQLRTALYGMSVTSELTKSDKGLYHAQINPAYGDDQQMSPADWLKAADMLGEELGLAEQRRVIVLHTKKGRTHGHVVWERYDHEKKKMLSDSFSRLAQDRARLAMEQVFEQTPTPHRNQKRPEMKQLLSDLWKKVATGAEFVKSAKKFGYAIAAGVQRRPFMVVDDTGRSFDLVRQLDGVKTKEVRERLKDEKLVAEKDAIAQVRKRQQLQQRQTLDAANDNRTKETVSKQEIAKLFAEGRGEMTQETGTGVEQYKGKNTKENAATRPDVEHTTSQESKNIKVAKGFAESWGDMKAEAEQPDLEKKKELAKGFADNRKDATVDVDAERARKKQEFMQSLETLQNKQKNQDKGIEPS